MVRLDRFDRWIEDWLIKHIELIGKRLKEYKLGREEASESPKFPVPQLPDFYPLSLHAFWLPSVDALKAIAPIVGIPPFMPFQSAIELLATRNTQLTTTYGGAVQST